MVAKSQANLTGNLSPGDIGGRHGCSNTAHAYIYILALRPSGPCARSAYRQPSRAPPGGALRGAQHAPVAYTEPWRTLPTQGVRTYIAFENQQSHVCGPRHTYFVNSLHQYADMHETESGHQPTAAEPPLYNLFMNSTTPLKTTNLELQCNTSVLAGTCYLPSLPVRYKYCRNRKR